MTKISIITVCYNEPNLEKTCESIVNQTMQDFEWVVIDGGSNEETQNIWNKYKHRINTFVSEPDNGIYDAYNKGVKLATGEYIIFMNAGDCFYEKNILDLFVFFHKNNNASIYYGQCELVSNTENKISHYPKEIDLKYFYTSNLCTQGMFISKSLFDKYGLFNENYRICADYEKWICFLTHTNKDLFKYIPVIIAIYDLNGISSNKKNKKNILYEINKISTIYFPIEKIMEFEKDDKIKYKFVERIFSIKNHPFRRHKIITILGIRLKKRIKLINSEK